MKFYFLIIFCYFIWLFDEKISGQNAVGKNSTDPSLPEHANTTQKAKNGTTIKVFDSTKNALANSETKSTEITTITTSVPVSTTSLSTPKAKDMEQKPKVEHTDTEIDDDDESIHSNEVVTNKNLDTANTEHNGNAQIVPPTDNTDEPGSSHFMTYFLMLVCLVTVSYVAFYKRKKLLGLIVEGRRSQADRKNVRYRKLREGATDEENGVQKGNVIY